MNDQLMPLVQKLGVLSLSSW